MASSQVPATLKAVSMFLKCAEQHDSRDIVVAYYCRLAAFKKGYTLDPSSKESKPFLSQLMTKLEEIKSNHRSEEAISNETIGLSHVESYALRLFKFAYNNDLNANFSKPTIQSFWAAGVLLDVTTTLSEATDELETARKYAKWKAVYIANCLKSGETPVPGPAEGTDSADVPTFALEEKPQPVVPSSSVTPAMPSTASIHQQPPAHPTPQLPVPARQEPDQEDDTDGISIQVYTSVEKHIRHALSALQHQDRKTVMLNLQQAMDALRH